MTRKTLGYIELEWTCPNCGQVNPGPERTCVSCGAPQPDDVKFEQATRQELITDEEVKAKVEAGADIHCPYCGTRNSAGTQVCVQCGGDLVEGLKRESGRVVGAYRTGPAAQISCPHCGTENPDTARTCSQCGGNLYAPAKEGEMDEATMAAKPRTRKTPIALIIDLAIILGGAALLMFLLLRTEEITGVVQEVGWERSIPIEALVPVTKNDWQDNIPPGADIGDCEEEVHSVEAEPAPNSVEVCGTPYNVDTGSGYAEVVQDCEYHVYDNYCSYSIEEWQIVDAAMLSGSDYSPTWPEPVLADGYRISEDRNETYLIIFDADGEYYTFETSDYDLFVHCQVGTTWNLNVNKLGAVVSIEQ